MTDALHFIFVELGRFTKEPEDRLDEFEMTKYLQNIRTEFDIRTEKLMAREEGREERIEIGMDKGIKEERSRIAASLKSMGMSIDDIAKATGLCTEAIAVL